jgi:hypothetical protein
VTFFYRSDVDLLSGAMADRIPARNALRESVCEILMIAFSMVVRHEVGDRVRKRGMSEEDHSVQTLGLY